MKQSSLPNDEELIEISPVINGKDSLHSSYRCISEKFPEELLRSSTLTQEQLREFYRTISQSDSRCIDLSSMSSNDIDRNLDEEIFSDPIEENLEAFLKNLNKKKRRILHREYERQGERWMSEDLLSTSLFLNQGHQINDKVKEIYENLSKNDEEFFYDFQRENFHAEQVNSSSCFSHRPSLFLGCTFCLSLLQCGWTFKISMSRIFHRNSSSNTIDFLQLVQCSFVLLSTRHGSFFFFHIFFSWKFPIFSSDLDRFRPTESDIEIRRKILDEVQQLLDENSFPCRVNAFGSFYNGFGFRHSDLDLSLVFPSDPSNDQVKSIHSLSLLLLLHVE